MEQQDNGHGDDAHRTSENVPIIDVRSLTKFSAIQLENSFGVPGMGFLFNKNPSSS